jgi:Phosphotransferase enzyme family
MSGRPGSRMPEARTRPEQRHGRPHTSDLRAGIDARVARVLAELGIKPTSVRPLANEAPVTRRPRAYMVVAADITVKIRFTGTSSRARRAAKLTALLADPRMPPPLAVVGTAMVDRWVDGELLGAVQLETTHLDAAADLLASINATRVPGAPRARSVAPLVGRFRRQLVELTASGLLDTASADELLAIVRTGLPDRARWSAVHTDLCAENLIVTPDSSLISIDNEHVHLGYVAYDLARSWYRWPKPDWATERLELLHAAALGEERLEPAEQRAWRLVAVVKSLHLRHRRGVSPSPSLRALACLAPSFGPVVDAG